MTAAELAQCIEDAKGNGDAIKECKKRFVDEGGKQGRQDGGKVFTDPAGGKVFVTDGGKVFDNRK